MIIEKKVIEGETEVDILNGDLSISKVDILDAMADIHQTDEDIKKGVYKK